MKEAPVKTVMYVNDLMDKSWRVWFSDLFRSFKSLLLPSRSADPATPGKNSMVMWLSDGTDSGDDGDIIIMITNASGTTKTTTLVDFSTL